MNDFIEWLSIFLNTIILGLIITAASNDYIVFVKETPDGIKYVEIDHCIYTLEGVYIDKK